MNEIEIALFKELSDVAARAIREKLRVSYDDFRNCT